MITAKPGSKPGNTSQHAGGQRRTQLLAVINLALLALGTFLSFTPEAPQPLQVLGRLLAVAVIVQWSLLEARIPTSLALRHLKTETTRSR